MSYSTRRSGGFAGQQQQQQQQQNVASIGQRRPVVTNNFVPGGQLNSQTKPAGQAPQQQAVRAQQPQQPNTSIQFRNQSPAQQQVKQAPPQVKPPLPQVKQQPPPLTKQPPPQIKQQPPSIMQQPPPQPQQQTAQQLQQQALQLQQQQQAQQQAQQVKMETASSQNNEFAPSAENVEGDANDDAMDTGEAKKKPFWARNRNKISKKEKVRRRNLMLSQTLKPKNAVMILNELVKSTSYAVEELPIRFDGNSFKATVVYEGTEHVGFGRNKMHAKNSAAETALKHYVKTHKLTEVKKDEEGNEKMDLSEEDAQNPLPWQHVVSFALFKLFCSWDEDPNVVKTDVGSESHEHKASKKMPANPELINPLMLVNQMLPQAQFEEIGKSGNPPNVVFSFKCTVNDQSFIGTGPNKKAAKRLAAFGACHKVLGVTYPPDVYVPIF